MFAIVCIMKNGHNQIPKEPNYKLRRTVAAGAAIAGLIGGALAVNNKLDSNTTQHFDKTEAAALKEAKTGRNAVVVLHEGVTYRSAPVTVNSNGEDGPDTVAGTVGKGQVLRIDRPITYVEQGVDASHDISWFGFTLGDKTDSTKPSNVFWVNRSQLAGQDANGHSRMDVYDYDIVNDSNMQHSSGPVDFTVNVDQNGHINADIGNKGGPAAIGNIMPETVFAHEVQTEHLILSPGK